MAAILGINTYLHDSAAALVVDGEVAFAVAEERLSRRKKDARFPRLSAAAALDHAGLRLQDLDAIAFGWNAPGQTPLHTLRASLTGQLPRSASYVGQSLKTVVDELRDGNGARRLRAAFGDPSPAPVLHIDHHASHAWSAYGLSGFDESLVLVADGRGSRQATSLYHARGDDLRLVKSFDYPNSLGSFYEAFTEVLGFQRHNDEWKVMGLAAYGQPTMDVGSTLRVTPGGYQVDADLVCGRTWGDLRPMERAFGSRRDPEREITEADMNLAASAQEALEQAMFEVVREGVRLTGCRNLSLAGGVAMNSKANGKILLEDLVDDIFVQPAATDDGTAIGAALAAHRSIGLEVPRTRMTNAYLGPEYTNEEIEETLRTFKLRYHHVPQVEREAAQLLSCGNVVGWFQGRMEFGPRALGNRSILGDPRSVETRDRVNASVKFREAWRPFAPSCLAESAGEYFERCDDAPYMILTFNVLKEQQSVIPAVTHADETARVQTVTREANPRYWTLLREFGALTGVPVLLNTSFNLKGEPIVCSPQDAIRTFHTSGLDFLVLGDFVLAKDPLWEPSTCRDS